MKQQDFLKQIAENAISEFADLALKMGIIDEVYPISEYFKTSRKRVIVIIRQMIMYQMRINNYILKSISLAEIGAIFNKDHATVLHAEKTINNLSETQPHFKKFLLNCNDIFIQIIKNMNPEEQQQIEQEQNLSDFIKILIEKIDLLIEKLNEKN